MVTDGDRPEEDCPSECYEMRHISPIPKEVLNKLAERECSGDDPAGVADPDGREKPTEPQLATRLKYVFLSARARAETVVHQRQPGLVEALVKQAIRHDRYNADLARTLFQLMVPLQFKATARDLQRLALVVDGYTANLPWEMLQADDEPIVLKTAMVRQLSSVRFRQQVHTTTGKTACIIVDPSTEGYVEEFGNPEDRPLPRLPGAVKEGSEVRHILESSNYQVTFVPPEFKAVDVMSRLFRDSYRILVVAAHGVFQATARDGTRRSGVVLSDGVLLTAAEVGQLEVVPEVAFLNCCHLGKVDEKPLPTNVNRLAYSLARELIEIGVRCVVVAGWAVNDQAARTFAKTFFDELVNNGKPFGSSIHSARRATYEGHPGVNTWGAYQAYGDPAFVLETNHVKSHGATWKPVAPEELLVDLAQMRDGAKHGDLQAFEEAQANVRRLLHDAPAGWSELPVVQAAIGTLYGEFGQPGFLAARNAYLRAIAEEDRSGRVPVKAIEQLSNLEARTAERLCEKRNFSRLSDCRKCIRDEARPMVEQAIGRLERLFEIAQELPAADTPAVRVGRPNLERWSILGSAFKTLASLLADLGKARKTLKDLSEALKNAQAAYKAAEGNPEDPAFNPYAMLNRLQLDALLAPDSSGDQVSELAARCKAAARNRFKEGYDFWDAVMVADAELTIRLADGAITDALLDEYLDAAREVPRSQRQWQSVVRQLRFVAKILRSHGDATQAKSLERVASSLDSNAGSRP
jgi:CHAT domain-containing protein/tetratricopeptide (TPR) repeat protein